MNLLDRTGDRRLAALTRLMEGAQIVRKVFRTDLSRGGSDLFVNRARAAIGLETLRVVAHDAGRRRVGRLGIRDRDQREPEQQCGDCAEGDRSLGFGGTEGVDRAHDASPVSWCSGRSPAKL